jgi:hypothetical protein
MRHSLGFWVCWRVAAASGRLKFEPKAVKRGVLGRRQHGGPRCLASARRGPVWGGREALWIADVASIGALAPNRLSVDGCGRAGARGIPLLLCSVSAKGKREGGRLGMTGGGLPSASAGKGSSERVTTCAPDMLARPSWRVGPATCAYAWRAAELGQLQHGPSATASEASGPGRWLAWPSWAAGLLGPAKVFPLSLIVFLISTF